MQRIQRLVSNDTHTRSRRPFAAAALGLALILGAFVAPRALTPVEARSAIAPSVAATPRREVAVTFVNYPGQIYDAGRLANKSRKLLRSLSAHGVQAVAFVNESKFYKEDGQPNEARVQTLRDWLDAGHELGNETARHTDLYKVTPEEFEADVLRGEQLIKQLSAERGRKVRYFSYPYLNVGPNLEVRGRVERFLQERGYQIHQVTIDNMDWLFSNAYIEALRREDEAAAAAIRADYVPYMERMFEFYENYSREVVGREIPQVLMLTGGALNADCFDELAAMLKRRGYTFVTMEQAQRDEAYSLPNTHTGARGDSWLARWAVTKGQEFKDTEEELLPESMRRHLADVQKRRVGKGDGKK